MTRTSDIQTKLHTVASHITDDEVYRLLDEAIEDIERIDDPYADRVRAFHDEVRERADHDYLTVVADRFERSDLPVPVDTPYEAEDVLAEMMAERNRLFWSSFLSEESGEVSKCLNDGEPPEHLQKEVADVVVLCFAIADVFGFDMQKEFHGVMDENDQKPMTQSGTGKLPASARDDWREYNG